MKKYIILMGIAAAVSLFLFWRKERADHAC